MPRSAGTYETPSNTVAPAVTGTPIDPDDFNDLVADLETAISDSVYTTAGLGASDNRVVRTDGTDGKKTQTSLLVVDDTGNLSGIGYIDVVEATSPGSPAANTARVYCYDDGGTTRVAMKDGSGNVSILGGQTSREILLANRTYYVRSDGSDSNTGLVNTAGGAFLTLQKAVDVACGLDWNGYTVTVQAGAHTYTAGVDVTKSPAGGGSLYILGDTTTPTNCLVSVTNAHGFLNRVRGVTLYVAGFKVQTTTGGQCFWCFGGDIKINGAINLGASAQDHFLATDGNLTIAADYTVSGGCVNHWHTYSNAQIVCQNRTITIPGAVTMTRWAGVAGPAILTCDGNTYTGSANVTGAKYYVHLNGVISAGSGVLPGTTAGSMMVGNYDDRMSLGAATTATQVVGSAIGMTTGNTFTLTSISVGPGEWNITGNAQFTGGATTTVTMLIASISNTTTIDSSSPRSAITIPLGGALFAWNNPTLAIPTFRTTTTATTTTFYLLGYAVFGTSTCSGFGTLTASPV